MQNLMKLYPRPNADSNATGGFNYVQAQTFNQNNTQWMSRVDYSISDNTKLFVRYNLQRETQLFPVGLWWRNGGQVPYPTPVQGKNRSDSVSVSLTHVFNPSMTNEFVFGYTFIGFPNVFEDPSKVDRTAVGYSYKGLFKNGVAQIPSFGGWGGGEAALVFNPGGFEAGGASAGSVCQQVHAQRKRHRDQSPRHPHDQGRRSSGSGSATPSRPIITPTGSALVDVGNSNSLGNAYADLLTGILNGYQERLLQPHQRHFLQHLRRLCAGFLEGDPPVDRGTGLRATHFQPWIDRVGFGYSIFDYSKYSPSCTPLQYCGFEWNKKNPAVPLGGFPTQGSVLPAAFWRRLRHRRQRQDGASRRMGPLLLPFRPVHRRSGRVRRSGFAQSRQQCQRRTRCWPRTSTR